MINPVEIQCFNSLGATRDGFMILSAKLSERTSEDAHTDCPRRDFLATFGRLISVELYTHRERLCLHEGAKKA